MSAIKTIPMPLPTLKAKINRGEIDTIVVAFSDVFGRLVGKRFTGEFFSGTGGRSWDPCLQLLADG